MSTHHESTDCRKRGGSAVEGRGNITVEVKWKEEALQRSQAICGRTDFTAGDAKIRLSRLIHLPRAGLRRMDIYSTRRTGARWWLDRAGDPHTGGVPNYAACWTNTVSGAVSAII